MEQARRTWPQARERFLRGLPPGHVFLITVRLTDALGRMEQVFVRVDQIDGNRIHGKIDSQIGTVLGWRRGDAFETPDGALIDWTILAPDGSESGNFVGRFLDTYRRR